MKCTYVVLCCHYRVSLCVCRSFGDIGRLNSARHDLADHVRTGSFTKSASNIPGLQGGSRRGSKQGSVQV